MNVRGFLGLAVLCLELLKRVVPWSSAISQNPLRPEGDTPTIELKITVLIGLLLGGVSSAQGVEIQPINLGNHTQFTATQFTDNTNASYRAGARNGFEYRDFFSFDLSSLTGQSFTNATLRVHVDRVRVEPTGSVETYTMFSVSSTTVANLGSVDLSVFNDLGSGTALGGRGLTEAEINTMVDIPFDADGLAAINASVGELFTFGGAITSIDSLGGPDETAFFFALYDPRNVLILETASPTPNASIAGTKWNDLNGNGIREAGESGLGGITIYLDSNNNGIREGSELFTVTSADGTYQFMGLAADTYVVREVVPADMMQTFPATGAHTINLAAGDVVASIDFGNYQPVHRVEITAPPAGDPNPSLSGGKAAMSVSAEDDNPSHTLSYAWSADCSSWAPGNNGSFDDASLQNPVWTGPDNTTGLIQACQITVVVSDGYGVSAEASFTQNVSAVPFGPGNLLVTPLSDTLFRGPIGGPFFSLQNPGCTTGPCIKFPYKKYTLANDGGSAISYVAHRLIAAGWIDIDGGPSSQGVLEAGASTEVFATINSFADELCAGDYSAKIAFLNEENGSGNTDRMINLTIKPVEEDAPVFTAAIAGELPEVHAEATGPLTPLLIVVPLVSDDGPGRLTLTVSDPGPYPLGTTVVTWSAVDCSGNEETANQKVVIEDTSGPVVTAPDPITIEATAPLTPITRAMLEAQSQATAVDLVDGAVEPRPSIAPNTELPLGVHQIAWIAKDSAGNTTTTSGEDNQVVAIVDTTPPYLFVDPDKLPEPCVMDITGNVVCTAFTSSPSDPVEIRVRDAFYATDAVDPGPRIVPSNGITDFNLGDYEIHWKAIDDSGNESAEIIQRISVQFGISLAAVEVMQVVQDLKNSVPLFDGKKTILRAYFETAGTEAVRVYPKLIAFRDGVQLPDTLTPSNFGGYALARPSATTRIVDRRARALRPAKIGVLAANFVLPATWKGGIISYQLIFPDAAENIDCSNAVGPVDDSCAIEVGYSLSTKFEVKIVRISSIDNAGNRVQPSQADIQDIMKRFHATFPTGKIDSAHTTTKRYSASESRGLTYDDIVSDLQEIREDDNCYTFWGCNRIYFGAVHRSFADRSIYWIYYDSQTSEFYQGEIITGTSSGATAIISDIAFDDPTDPSDSAGRLTVSIFGAFTPGELITGTPDPILGFSGGSAIFRSLSVTGKGGLSSGLWETSAGSTLSDEASDPAGSGNGIWRTVATHEVAHGIGIKHPFFRTTSDGEVGPCGADSDSDEGVFPYTVFDMPSIPGTVFGNGSSLNVGRTRRGRVATLGPMPDLTACSECSSISGNENVVIGYDGERERYISPRTNFELMSYCGPRFSWPSKRTYRDMAVTACDWFETGSCLVFPPTEIPTIPFFPINLAGNSTESIINLAVNSAQSVVVSSSGANASIPDHLVIKGYVDIETGELIFRPFGRLVNPKYPPTLMPEGDFSMQLYDSQGLFLDEVKFEPDSEIFHWTGERSNMKFVIPVPLNSDLGRVEVLREGQSLGSIEASEHLPAVQVLYPNGGETLLGDTITFEWEGSDADGDELSYTVLFSPDNGENWQTLDLNLTETFLTVDSNSLPQTDEGLIRVQVSDGFLTSYDLADAAFSTLNSLPEMIILNPIAHAVYGGDQTIVMNVLTSDLEDGELEDTRIEWVSDLDGSLGLGGELTLEAKFLSPGNHVITVIGTDSDGGVGSDALPIKVIGTDFPPIVVAHVATSPNRLWPPNHKMVPVEVIPETLALPELDQPTCSIVDVQSNEPDDDKKNEKFAGDWVIFPPLKLELRAERSAKGSGREYRIMVECSITDIDGTIRTARETGVVSVPVNDE